MLDHANTREPLDMLITVPARSKERLYRFFEREGVSRHYIHHANILTVRTEQPFTKDLIHAYIGKRGTLAKERIIGTIQTLEAAAMLRKNDWNLEMIGAHPERIGDGRGSVIAVLDTGIDYTHEEFAESFRDEKGIDIVYGSDPMDRDGHGTHVAGIIAGSTIGVAPGAQLYAVKVLNDFGSGSESDVIKGVDWSIGRADVINMSLGGSTPSTAFQEIITIAARESTIVAAAGNSGYGPHYPASYDHVLSVVAIDKDKKRASFSNKWHTNDLSAPGVGIRSSIPGGYATYSGTSMASPHVAGCAAILHAQKRSGIETLLMDNAERLPTPPGEDHRELYGAGIVRIDRATSTSAHITQWGKKLWNIMI